MVIWAENAAVFWADGGAVFWIWIERAIWSECGIWTIASIWDALWTVSATACGVIWQRTDAQSWGGLGAPPRNPKCGSSTSVVTWAVAVDGGGRVDGEWVGFCGDPAGCW